MFAAFRGGVAAPPPELLSTLPNSQPIQSSDKARADSIVECINGYRAATEASGHYGSATISILFGNDGGLAFQTGNGRVHVSNCDELYVGFHGILANAGEMREQLGFRRCNNSISDALVVLELYRNLRDRAPYSVDHTLRMLRGSFSFVLWDSTMSSVFAARDEEGRSPLFWGLRPDGSVVFSSQKESVQKAGAVAIEFPAGCFYTTALGMQSFMNPGENAPSTIKPMMAAVDSVQDFCLEARTAG